MKPLKTRWLMNIKDKISCNNGNHCPPHHLPHTLPIIGEKITDEPCHIHNTKWRMAHHTTFCKLIKCPHYEKMMKFKEKYENKKSLISPS